MPINVITLPTSMAPPALRAQYGLPPVAQQAAPQFPQSPAPVAFGSTRRNVGLISLGLGALALAAKGIEKWLSPSLPPVHQTAETTRVHNVSPALSEGDIKKAYDPGLFMLLSDKAAELGRNLTPDEVRALAAEVDAPERQLLTIAKGFGFVENGPAGSNS